MKSSYFYVGKRSTGHTSYESIAYIVATIPVPSLIDWSDADRLRIALLRHMNGARLTVHCRHIQMSVNGVNSDSYSKWFLKFSSLIWLRNLQVDLQCFPGIRPRFNQNRRLGGLIPAKDCIYRIQTVVSNGIKNQWFFKKSFSLLWTLNHVLN